MGEHPLRRDVPALDDVTGERDHGLDLCVRVGRHSARMAGMRDLDPERHRVESVVARPGAAACVPGTPRLRHELKDAAVIEDEIVRRDLGQRIAEKLQGLCGARHVGVVQDEHVRPPPAAIIMVR